jgi:transcriptional regulator with PAS, ATPase and Fis domain
MQEMQQAGQLYSDSTAIFADGLGNAARDADFIGRSPAIARIQAAARAVAARPTTVMLLGETGSGKEMLARYVHAHSPRAARPFIAVDCSAFSETLFESQLFGHVKGAFTGAVRDAIGFMRAADGGTFFLDEIGELTLPLQAKLLRVLQERCIIPVGDTRTYPVDIRIICATNRDLWQMVEAGTFRQDLFFRLNVVTLSVPALRERADDIPALAAFFLAKQATLADEPCKALSAPAADALLRYPWPGNIRELFNALEHAHVLSAGPIIELDDLPLPLHAVAQVRRPIVDDDLNLANVERIAIVEALKRTRCNRAAASRLLGIEPRRLNRRIATLRISMGRAV